MKKLLAVAVAATMMLVLAAAATAALEPGVLDPNCATATYSKGALHLTKSCPTTAVAAAGAEITGFAGQTFQSAQFTLKSATQCQGGSPRFLVITDTGWYPLGCNNVTPTTNANGSVTYVFTPQSISSVTWPTGKVEFISLIVDVQGTADVSRIKVNGITQKPAKTKGDLAAACKNGGWKTFTNPKFKNQGQCVSAVVHARNATQQATNTHKKKQ